MPKVVKNGGEVSFLSFFSCASFSVLDFWYFLGNLKLLFQKLLFSEDD